MHKNQLVRFALVGIINTAVDSIIFVTLQKSGLAIFLANLFSTSIALAISLVLNSRFTFKNKNLQKKQIVYFILVTLVGLWLLQPIVIETIVAINHKTHFISQLPAVFNAKGTLVLLIPKFIAISMSLVWNYMWYSKVVFRAKSVYKNLNIIHT